MNHELLTLKTPDDSGQPFNVLAAPSGIPESLRSGATSTNNLLQLGIQLLFFVGITIAVIVFMISGIQWITSGGDPTKVSAAKRRLFFALLGIILMSGAFFAVNLIISILVGSDSSKFLNPTTMFKP